MSKNNDEKQLLEDASTLLMFANVAARQQTPSSPQLAKPPLKQHTNLEALPASSSFSMEPKLAYIQAQAPGILPPLTTPPQPPFGAQSESPASLNNSLAPASQSSVHLQPKGGLPHIMGGFHYYPYGYGGQLLPPTTLPPASVGPLQPPALSTSLSPLEVPHIKSETEHSVAQPQERSANPLSSGTPPQVSVSGLGLLPAQGKFQTHKSTPPEAYHKTSALVSSPRTAGLVLSRGINIETGERNNNNAVIAAAALAAAAENPLPLKPIESHAPKIQLPKEESDVPDTALTEPEDDLNKTDDEQPHNASEYRRQEETETLNLKVVDLPSTLQDLVKTTSESPQEKTKPESSKPKRTPTPTLKEELASAKSPAQVELAALAHLETGASKVPSLESYQVHPDSGVIGCICGIEEDDGFTIQCDICYRWQHCMCMGYKTNDEVPEEEYKCYYCDESKHNRFDASVCRNDTLRRLDMEKASSEPPEKPPATKRKTLSSGHEDKKRRKSEKDVKAYTTEKSSADKRKPSKSNGAASPGLTNQALTKICNKENSQLEDGASAESYQGVYYKLTANDYKTPEVKEELTHLGSILKAVNNAASAIPILSLSAVKSMKLSKVFLPNNQQHQLEKNENTRKGKFNEYIIQVKPYSDNPKQRYVGVPKTGVFVSDRMKRTGQEITIPTGTALIEYLGEVDHFGLYASNKINQYDSWGTLKPKVVKVDLSIIPDSSPHSFVLDSRFVGNETRFIRKSCIHTANCAVKPIFVPELKVFKFFVYTTRPISLKGENMEEELRLPWQWDDGHPIRKMINITDNGDFEEGEKFEDFTDEEKVLLVSGVDKLLNFVECACNTTTLNLMCLIFKVKKATSYLLRSTRKASNLSNTAFNKSKEELVMPKKDRDFVSWKERLIERDEAIRLVMAAENPASSLSLDELGNTLGILSSSNDGNTSVISMKKIIGDSTPNFPFKTKVFAQGKRYASRNFRFEVNDSDKIDDDAMLHVPKIIAVPLVNEILSTIKDTVKKKLQPSVFVGSPNLLKGEQSSTELASHTLPKNESPAPSSMTEEVAIEKPSQVAPHPVVKKLSFADYKKKMK